MTDKTELLPCPFCGGGATIRADADHSASFWIGCATDGCLGCDHWEEDYAEAIAAWNTRALTANQPADPSIEALVEAMHRVSMGLQDSGTTTIEALGRLARALAASQTTNSVANAGSCQPVKVKPPPRRTRRGQLANAGSCQAVQPLAVQDAARTLLTALEQAEIDMETLRLFFNGQPVVALRAIAEGGGMSGSELVWARAWKPNPNEGQLETNRTIGWENAEYIRADAVAETIRRAVQAEREACAIAAGNAAVEALLRQEPEAGLLRRQMVRTNAIRAIRARDAA